MSRDIQAFEEVPVPVPVPVAVAEPVRVAVPMPEVRPVRAAAVLTRGTVRWVSDRRSGYIRCQDRTDIFFHVPSADGKDHLNLKPGQVVEFQVTRGAKGRHAEQVALVKPQG